MSEMHPKTSDRLMEGVREGYMDRYIINEYSKIVIVESKWWHLGICCVCNFFNFSAIFENFLNEMLGEEFYQSQSNQPTN